jgi:putative DNA primase/helicase
VLRSFIAARSPKVDVPPFGGFEGWSRRVREALVWLGEPDPYATFQTARDSDPLLGQLRGLMTLWESLFGDGDGGRRRAREIARAADDNPDLRELLLAIASDRGGTISTRRLGIWLSAVQGRVVGGLRIVKGKMVSGADTWRLECVER